MERERNIDGWLPPAWPPWGMESATLASTSWARWPGPGLHSDRWAQHQGQHQVGEKVALGVETEPQPRLAEAELQWPQPALLGPPNKGPAQGRGRVCSAPGLGVGAGSRISKPVRPLFPLPGSTPAPRLHSRTRGVLPRAVLELQAPVTAWWPEEGQGRGQAIPAQPPRPTLGPPPGPGEGEEGGRTQPVQQRMGEGGGVCVVSSQWGRGLWLVAWA